MNGPEEKGMRVEIVSWIKILFGLETDIAMQPECSLADLDFSHGVPVQ